MYSEKMALFEDWKMIPTMVLGVTRGRMRLTLTIAEANGDWLCVALTSPKSPREHPDEMMEDFIGAHAHKALPVQRDLRAAMSFAEQYAIEWSRSAQAVADDCVCEEIKPAIAPAAREAFGSEAKAIAQRRARSLPPSLLEKPTDMLKRWLTDPRPFRGGTAPPSSSKRKVRARAR